MILFLERNSFSLFLIFEAVLIPAARLLFLYSIQEQCMHFSHLCIKPIYK